MQVILKLDLKATGAWALKISTFMSATDVQKENATDVEDIMRSGWGVVESAPMLVNAVRQGTINDSARAEVLVAHLQSSSQRCRCLFTHSTKIRLPFLCHTGHTAFVLSSFISRLLQFMSDCKRERPRGRGLSRQPTPRKRGCQR